MEVFEAIKNRHSYRSGYSEEPVKHEDIVKILEAGIDAPSGCNAQTTMFCAIDNSEIVAKIAALHPVNKAMQQAKAFIACVVDISPESVFEGMDFAIEDCAAAVENMLLAITALGYSSVWIDGWLRRENRAQQIGEMINIPDGKIVRILLPLGVANEEFAVPPKKGIEERTWFNYR